MSGANNTKGNFKTYEGQARLLRAMVAAHPEVKWNCKALAEAYGSDTTVYSMEHRMRDIKAQAKIVASATKAGVDCREIPVDLPKTEKEIARLYGASTADGIQWQFRSIKKDAEALKNAAKNGRDPSSAIDFGTPKSKASAMKGTPGSKRSFSSAGGRSTGGKRQKTHQIAADNDDDDEDDDDVELDFDAQDTPSKPRVKKEEDTKAARASIFGGAKPSRAATAAAADAIKNQSSALSIDITSDEEIQTPPASHYTNGTMDKITAAHPNAHVGTYAHNYQQPFVADEQNNAELANYYNAKAANAPGLDFYGGEI